MVYGVRLVGGEVVVGVVFIDLGVVVDEGFEFGLEFGGEGWGGHGCFFFVIRVINCVILLFKI